MLLRLKVAVLLLVALAVNVIAAWVVHLCVLRPAAAETERREAMAQLDRCAAEIDRELDRLRGLGRHWAQRDETFRFAHTVEQDYVDRRLDPSDFTTHDLDLIAFYTVDGRPIWTRIQSRTSDQPIDIPELQFPLRHDHVLLRHKNLDSQLAGVFITPRGPMLAVSTPVTDTGRKELDSGVMVIGRWLDRGWLAHLSELTGAKLHVYEIREAEAAGVSRSVVQAMTSADERRLVGQGDRILGYARLNAIDGRPVMLLEATMQSTTLADGLATLDQALQAIIVITFGGMAGVAILFERWVIRPQRPSRAKKPAGDALPRGAVLDVA